MGYYSFLLIGTEMIATNNVTLSYLLLRNRSNSRVYNSDIYTL
jgi:hypothetical protein